MILRNHGLLTVGRTVADAFLAMFTLESACRIQVMAQAGGAELLPVGSEVMQTVAHAVRVQAADRRSGGELMWPALLRRLERVSPGFAD